MSKSAMTATIRPGVSEAAEILKRVQNEFWKSQDETVTFSSHPLDNQLIDVYCHCSQDNWEGEDSVAVDRESNDEELWKVGYTVVETRGRNLHGRSDIAAIACKVDSLEVIAKPLDGNPNHADIDGFPSKKEDQMSLATKLAASAGSRLEPPAQS